MKKFLTTLIITIILITGTSSVFALTEYDKETILGYIATRQNSITYNYGEEIFENIENFNYVLFGTGYHNDRTNILLTNVIPNTDSTTFSNIQNLKTLQYGTSVDYGFIYNITSTPTVKLLTTTSKSYSVEAATTFNLKPTNGGYGILNSSLVNTNADGLISGGKGSFNFLNTEWLFDSNELIVYLGKNYNSNFEPIFNKPENITISLYDVRGVLSSQRIYRCDYESEDYDPISNAFIIDLDKNDFYSSNTDVYLKIIVGVSSGTNWYERWYTPPIEWNQEAGTGGENPPIGGSSNITGTITGNGTVDENGNITIDNSINLDTTPITDAIQQGNDYIMQEPIYDENGELAEEQGGLVGAILKGIQNIFKWLFGWLFEIDTEYVGGLINDFSESIENNGSMIAIPMYLLTETIELFTNYTPQDFVLEWENIDYQGITFIKSGSINFNEIVNENEVFEEIYNTWIIIESFGIIILLANWLRNLFFELLGIDWNGFKTDPEEVNSLTLTDIINANTGEIMGTTEVAERYNKKTHIRQRRITNYGKE